jgi:hypothetical protein
MARSLEEEKEIFSSAKVEEICKSLTYVFEAYANAASEAVNGNEPDITIIDQASASAADAHCSSSFLLFIYEL